MRFASNRSDELLHCVADLDADHKSQTTIALEILKRLPDGVFAYWLTEGVQRIFARFPALDQGATATFGLHCRGDERFYRAWWEVDPSQLDENAWPSVFLGGTPQRLYRDCYYVVEWRRTRECCERWLVARPVEHLLERTIILERALRIYILHRQHFPLNLCLAAAYSQLRRTVFS